MITESDQDLATYLTELLITNEPFQENNTFWFPTIENLGNIEHRTPIQARVLKNCVNCNKKKNKTQKMMQSPEWKL